MDVLSVIFICSRSTKANAYSFSTSFRSSTWFCLSIDSGSGPLTWGPFSPGGKFGFGAFGEGRGWGAGGAGLGVWALEIRASVASDVARTATAMVILGGESDMDTPRISEYGIAVAVNFIPNFRKEAILFCVGAVVPPEGLILSERRNEFSEKLAVIA